MSGVDVGVRVEGDRIIVNTPYDALFVKKIKKTFTESERRYDQDRKLWLINYTQENYELVYKMVQEHFSNTEEKLVIFKCNGGAPVVNGMRAIDYTRDYDRKARAWCFEVIKYVRFSPYGSRRYPQFHGIVLAKVLMNNNTEIECEEYRVYPYTKSLHVTAVELVENAESINDYEKIVGELDKMAQKLEGFGVEVGKEAVAVKGLLVMSTLPSKALLENIIPKEFKKHRIGREVIQIVRGYFYNKLGTLSRKFYNEILQKHGVYAGFGYIIPSHRVHQFIKDIEELREEYRKFEEELRNFIEKGEIPERLQEKVEQGRVNIDPEYLTVVREYLAEHGITEIKVPDIANRVRIRLIPFSIDVGLVEEYLEEKAVESVQRELDAVKQEMAEAIREQLEERVNAIFERLKNYENKKITKTVLRKLKEDIDYVVKTTEELGVNVSRVDALRRMVEVIEEGDIETVAEEADGRLKALLKEISSS